VVSFTPLLLYPRGKSPRYPLDRSLCGPQSQSGQRGEEKMLDPNRLELRPLGCPAHSRSLYRLRYPGCTRGLILEKRIALNIKENLDSSVCIAKKYGLDSRCSIPNRGKKVFSTPQRRDLLPIQWVPDGSFLWRKAARA
jgi:hypothetical protein